MVQLFTKLRVAGENLRRHWHFLHLFGEFKVNDYFDNEIKKALWNISTGTAEIHRKMVTLNYNLSVFNHSPRQKNAYTVT